MAKKFSGPLSEPIRPKSGEDGFDELMTKMLLLFDHYGLAKPGATDDPTEQWVWLAMLLASDLFPGMKVKPDWAPSRDTISRCNWARAIHLIVDVHSVVKERDDCSISEAVKILVGAPRFVKKYGGKNKRSLENQYHMAVRSPGVRSVLASVLRKYHES